MDRVIAHPWLLLLVALAIAGCVARSAPNVTARTSASTLGQAADTASADVSAEGTLDFDAAWASQAIMTAHWTSTTREWSKAVALSTTGFGGSSVKVAAAPSGAAAVMWASNGHIGRLLTVVDARYRASANSPWQRTGTLLASRGEAVVSPQLGIDRHGDAFAMWGTVDGAIDMAEHPAGADSWSPTATIVSEPRGPGIGAPELAVSPTGTLALVWEHYLTGTTMAATTFRPYLTIKPAGQSSWLPTLNLGIEGLFPAHNDITSPYQARGSRSTHTAPSS